MRTILFLLQKEFLQIIRDRTMLPLIIAMPIIQLLILSNAATYEVKNIPYDVVDYDKTSTTRELLTHFSGSDHFSLVRQTDSRELAMQDMLENKVSMIINIPHGLERDLVMGKPCEIQLVVDAIDGARAGIAASYSSSILLAYNSRLTPKMLRINPASNLELIQNPPPSIEVNYRYWFNPQLNYKNYMIPGILVLLVTMIGLFLSAMNIVKEREVGTIEQLNVTPIKRYQFVIGKLLPFWIIGLFELALGLSIAALVFHIPNEGSLLLIFTVAAIYLLGVLGMGLVVSTITETQQQAMFMAWFISMIFMLMGGLFTPIDSMPIWAKALTRINPIAYFIEVMRRIMLKGAGFSDILFEFSIICLIALVLVVLAMRRYRKVA